MKKCGILLPIFSLPSKYGIGTLGKEAYKFVDFLKATKQSIWQILPLSQTSFGDSPYQSPSAFAGNPYFLDPDILCKKGYVTAEDFALLSNTEGRIDYGRVYNERYAFLRRAHAGFLRSVPQKYFAFCKREREWLDSYALFMSIKFDKNVGEFLNWDEETVKKQNLEKLTEKYSRDIEFWKFLQFEFDEEWRELRRYANGQGIKIMGDLPIYTALDSADVWGNPEEFLLGEDLRPTKVAGVPPDAFSAEGQLWGNPLYNWERMREGGYAWWKRRFKRAKSLYDIIRIDHFVGFSNYYSIPATAASATEGEVVMGVGYPFFEEVMRDVGKIDIVAEDLGMLQNGVAELLSKTGFPNMRVIQFSFGGECNPHAIENHVKNCVVYTGTHDNSTSYGYWKSLPNEEKRKASAILSKDGRHISDRFINTAMSSIADTVIIPMTDYMRLDDSARLNAPSTTGCNWSWRLPKRYNTACLRERVYEMAKKHKRSARSFKKA